MSGEFGAGSEAKDKVLGSLGELAKKYTLQEVILGGVDEAAVANNLLVVEGLRAAGKRLDSRFNEVFGFHLGGSRIRGINTVESDIDVVIVAPDTTGNTGFIYNAIREELDKRGIENEIDGGVGWWMEHEVKTDPEEFIYGVDHHELDAITLFGNGMYQNPNLLLARLATLEVVDRYPQRTYPWQALAERYAANYLGERDHVVSKCVERYDEPRERVEAVFSHRLFRERYREFGLKDPKTLLVEHRQWLKENEKGVKKYKMFGVYREVLGLLNTD